MIIRSIIRAHAPRIASRRVFSVANWPIKTTRRYSTSNASVASSTPQSQASMLATITADLDKIAPRFEIEADRITIIQTPIEFYETLKDKISRAQRRIYLSTLYIGKTEHELISTIRNALATNPNLRISFLTDSLRGTRETPKPSTASLLTPLITEFGSDRVEVRMYHTPNLTGLRKKYIPKRINEGWGLQHMKLYGIDDEIILSGANLSSDYFSNRQDRYHIFHSADLTNYFAKIHAGVASLSFDIQPSDAPESGGYRMSWPASNPAPSPLDNPKAYKDSATKHLAHLLTPSNSPPKSPPSTNTTTIHPILSLVPLLSPQTSTELPALTSILTHLSTPRFANASWTFTAGYFNMTPSFRRLLLATRPAHATVLTAHPHANGFYGSSGVSGMLPAAYTHMAKTFLRKVRTSGLSSNIALREWKKGVVGEQGGWTYHAKGLWVTLPSPDPNSATQDPSLTVLGSSNYTKRAYELDLEANVVIATTDPGLRGRLREEVEWLGKHAESVEERDFEKEERRVGWRVRASMWVVRVVGGAL